MARNLEHALFGRLVAGAVAAAALIAGVALGCSSDAAAPAAGTFAAPAPGSSAGGTGILLVRDSGILERDPATGAERLLVPTPASGAVSYPRWSPDGTRIAYVSTIYPTRNPPGDWGSRLVVAVADGSDPRAVLSSAQPGLSVDGIEWSADGSALYAATSNQNAGQPLRLERIELARGTRTTVVESAAYPAAARDGSQIAFLTFSSGALPPGLWTAAPDGTDRRLILPLSEQFAGLRWPRFSPDSSQIAFGAVDGPSALLPTPTCTQSRRAPWEPRTAAAHGPPIDIWAMPADGSSAPRQVAALREDDPYVAWSPNGGQLAVLGACGLYELPLTGEVRRLGPGVERSQLDWR